MKFEKGFNPGQNNTYTEVNLGDHSQYLPNVTELTINNGVTKEDTRKDTPRGDASPKSPFDRMKEPEENIDITPIRTVILNYVSRLQPVVVDEWKQSYMKLWEGILELDIVAKKVFQHRKQQKTDFDKYTVCNIIHYLRRKKILADINDSELTRKLEGNDQHSIRTHAVNKDPDEATCKALDNYLETFKL